MTCKACDENGNKRGTHKPVPGLYDGEPITTCAWCGATLGICGHEANEKRIDTVLGLW